jgi:hypothetical protein
MHAQSVMEVGEVETLLILDAGEVAIVICLLHFPAITLPQMRGYPILRQELMRLEQKHTAHIAP